MNFNEAISAAVVQGIKIRLPGWLPESFIYFKDGKFRTPNGYEYIFLPDVVHNDWKVYEDPNIVRFKDLKVGEYFKCRNDTCSYLKIKPISEYNALQITEGNVYQHYFFPNVQVTRYEQRY